MTENKIFALLSELGICDKDSIDHFYPRVRDRDDVAVMRCGKSGVIFLSRSDHIDLSHYENKEDFNWAGAVSDLNCAALSDLKDNQRRAAQFETEICNRRWLDVGTGPGGILDLLAAVASETQA